MFQLGPAEVVTTRVPLLYAFSGSARLDAVVSAFVLAASRTSVSAAASFGPIPGDG